DGDAVGVAALRVGDLELGEDRLGGEVAEAELLLAAELPPQLDLPVFQGHVFRLDEAGEVWVFWVFVWGLGVSGPGLFAAQGTASRRQRHSSSLRGRSSEFSPSPFGGSHCTGPAAEMRRRTRLCPGNFRTPGPVCLLAE